jgi:hypothetical protein
MRPDNTLAHGRARVPQSIPQNTVAHRSGAAYVRGMDGVIPEMPARSPAPATPLSPRCRLATLAKLDGRRKEARLLRDTRAELVEHVGGRPSAVQRRLIERAAMLALRLALMDARAPDGNLSERDAREYLCWNNAYVRTLRELGIQPAAERPMSPADALAAARALLAPQPAPRGRGGR